MTWERVVNGRVNKSGITTGFVVQSDTILRLEQFWDVKYEQFPGNSFLLISARTTNGLVAIRKIYPQRGFRLVALEFPIILRRALLTTAFLEIKENFFGRSMGDTEWRFTLDKWVGPLLDEGLITTRGGRYG